MKLIIEDIDDLKVENLSYLEDIIKEFFTKVRKTYKSGNWKIRKGYAKYGDIAVISYDGDDIIRIQRNDDPGFFDNDKGFAVLATYYDNEFDEAFDTICNVLEELYPDEQLWIGEG